MTGTADTDDIDDTANPAVAQAIVTHAESLCQHNDHLWDVINELVVPTDLLTDTRNQNKVKFKTDEATRAFLYKEIRGLSQEELADRLQDRALLLKRFHFNVQNRTKAPRQPTISNIWDAFGDGTKRIIKAAAKGIAQLAVEHGVIKESLVPILHEDDEEEDEDDDGDDDDTGRGKMTRTIKLARKHAFPEFESGRTLNRTYEDEQILDMVARTCAYKGSANSEGEYAWLTDDDHTAHGSTILRVLKKFATVDASDAQLTLDEILDDDRMPEIDAIRSELMESFNAALDNIITAIQGGGPLSDRHKKAAIDITTQQFHASPWKDKDNGIARTTYPRMVSGYDDDGDIKRGYKFATITLAGDLVPLILGVEPVKENSAWEEDDAPSYSKADLVDRLLEQATRFVDIDEVFLDRGFHSAGVYAAIEDYGITYTAPVRKYEEDYIAIKKIEEHPEADAAVLHDVPVAIDGEVHHYAEYLYVPSSNDDEDGQYAIFITNRDHVDTDEIEAICSQYSRRWDIENQYKSLKECLPRTASVDYRIRFCNFLLTCLMYNLWRLTDYLVKVAKGVPIWSDPETGFKVFVRALGDYLRRIG